MNKETILNKCLRIDDNTKEGRFIANYIRANIEGIEEYLKED